ncbi:histidine acid phosphatase [Colletotrichum tamarilloi]|uniref:Phytase A n=1 Tax=Colletotrichum tamarilloi TaxID=1209934 RepID=A0ABQ9RNG8_9PEZI|nr:histidine acid phosphatase [Colletotrichum tamarilloi]KAK1507675.1 histidine acid phosphatase [Colletotrichum tamarilloi]
MSRLADVATSAYESVRGLLMGKAYKYNAIPDEEGERDEGDEYRESHAPDPKRRLCYLTIAAMAFAIFLSLALGFSLVSGQAPRNGLESISQFWGQYSPFFPVPSDIDTATPQGCEVTFAQVLSRHGARDPTAGKTATYKALVDRIHANVTNYGKGFEFIKTYQYTLGADELTPFGQRELVDSGEAFYKRYQPLAAANDIFIRASGQNRVVESGLNWTEGFFGAKLADGHSGPDGGIVSLITIIPEEKGVNNTLDHGLCTAFEDGAFSKVGDEAQVPWREAFTPAITARLNENLPGANLTAEDTIAFMQLCPFNTVVNGTQSPFCDLFTLEEWKDLEYYETLGKYYGFNAGNPLGPTQGVGFTNELLARLTGQPVVDRTSTNATLDADPATFPLDKKLYADFSHDNDMMAIYGALGLYNETAALSKTNRTSVAETKGFTASWTVPFAARMYVEKMKCGGGSDEELVRILVNDRVVPLVGCGADGLGRCKLGAFVDSMGFAKSGGLWDQCFV